MTKVPNLLACYRDLASGEPVEQLLRRYVKIEVLVALELEHRGITLRELEEFIAKRNAHVEAMLNTPPKKVVTFSKRLMRK